MKNKRHINRSFKNVQHRVKAEDSPAPQFRTTPIKIEEELIESWRQTVLKFARKPAANTSIKISSSALLEAIIFQEQSNIKSLWEVFTSERDRLPVYLMDPKKQRVSYLLGFHLPNMARIKGVIERVEERWELLHYLAESGKRVLFTDLGCGTGAISQVFRNYAIHGGVKENMLELCLVDSVGAYLDAARAGLESLNVKSNIRAYNSKVDEFLIKFMQKEEIKKNTIFAFGLGYIWNELAAKPESKALFLKLMQRLLDLEAEVLIYVLEPANQWICRLAMELRDILVEKGFHALYPCFHDSACPLLEKKRDWCYSEFVWKRPSSMAKLDKKLGINRENIKTASYFFASPKTMSLIRVSGVKSGGVVVGRPQHVKEIKRGREIVKLKLQSFDYLICNEKGLMKSISEKGEPVVLRGDVLSNIHRKPEFRR